MKLDWGRFDDWDTEVLSLYGSNQPFYDLWSHLDSYPRGLGAWIDLGAGDDRVSGSDGNDFIIGGAGSDWMDGQAGADTYFISRDDGSVDHISDLAWTETRRNVYPAKGFAAMGDDDIVPVALREPDEGDSLAPSGRHSALDIDPAFYAIYPKEIPVGPANEDVVELEVVRFDLG